jgi:hypothetical protein
MHRLLYPHPAIVRHYLLTVRTLKRGERLINFPRARSRGFLNEF